MIHMRWNVTQFTAARGRQGGVVPSVTAVRPKLWDNTLTPALQRYEIRGEML